MLLPLQMLNLMIGDDAVPVTYVYGGSITAAYPLRVIALSARSDSIVGDTLDGRYVVKGRIGAVK